MTKDKVLRPAVGVAAVVWKDNRFLLIKRGKEPRKGEWSLPGGHQEWGETVRQAVQREIHEETGLKVQGLCLVDVVDAIMPGTEGQIEHHFTLIDFRCDWLSGDARAGDDAVDVRWLSLEDLEGMEIWQETRRIVLMSA